MAISRAQLAVYAAIGVCLLLLGIRAVRSTEPSGASGGSGGGVHISDGPVGGGGDSGAPAVSGGDVVVHVAGAVAKPGVYSLPAGSRVTDAVERAGGGTGDADPNAINLAARLADGQQIVVPPRTPGGTTAAAGDGPISLGSADESDLEEIDGIGPVTAADIIEFRDAQGGISSIEELDDVPGIGPATLESLSGSLQP